MSEKPEQTDAAPIELSDDQLAQASGGADGKECGSPHDASTGLPVGRRT